MRLLLAFRPIILHTTRCQPSRQPMGLGSIAKQTVNRMEKVDATNPHLLEKWAKRVFKIARNLSESGDIAQCVEWAHLYLACLIQCLFADNSLSKPP